MSGSKTVKISILAEVSKSCFNCIYYKEFDETTVKCTADNDIDIIDVGEGLHYIPEDLLCNGNDWEMDGDAIVRMIKDDEPVYFQNPEKIELLEK